MHGWEEAVFYRGEEVGRRQRFDTRLLLAHLARLDKLAESAAPGMDGAALDAAIATLARGAALPDEHFDKLSANGEGENSHDPVPSVPSSSAEDEDDPLPCESCGGACNGPEEALTEADCMWLGNRLDRMDAARPGGAALPDRLAVDPVTSGEVEEIQLEAFEQGLDEWWLIASDEELAAAALREPAEAPGGCGIYHSPPVRSATDAGAGGG
jgi:hypothetical protein